MQVQQRPGEQLGDPAAARRQHGVPVRERPVVDALTKDSSGWVSSGPAGRPRAAGRTRGGPRRRRPGRPRGDQERLPQRLALAAAVAEPGSSALWCTTVAPAARAACAVRSVLCESITTSSLTSGTPARGHAGCRHDRPDRRLLLVGRQDHAHPGAVLAPRQLRGRPLVGGEGAASHPPPYVVPHAPPSLARRGVPGPRRGYETTGCLTGAPVGARPGRTGTHGR